MDALTYRLLAKTPELVSARRVALDRYANIAQISQISIFVGIPWCKLIFAIVVKTLSREDDTIQARYTALLARYAKILEFRLSSEVVAGYGTYEEWIIGLLWVAWLGFLCFHGTAPDYLHLAMRFGLIGASQLPVHYFLAMKHPYSPFQILLKSSHELIIVWHKATGKIIILLCALHAMSYCNAFIQMNMFWKAARQPKIVVALMSIGIFLALGVTSSGPFRRRRYSWFYKVHVVGAGTVPLLLFFHVSHIRPYLVETAAVFAVNVILRTLSSHICKPEITIVSQSNTLMKIAIKSQGTITPDWLPGQHVYLRQGNSRFLSYFTRNPFTIASLPTDGQTIVLIVRLLNGNTKTIYDTSGLTHRRLNSKEISQFSLEGPYGYSRYLAAPTEFRRVCFVAGGVGATYIIPIWRFFLSARQALQEFRLVWTVRSIADSAWAFEYLVDESMGVSTGPITVERQLYVTGTDAGKEEDMSVPIRAGFKVSKGRPDLKSVVDITVFGNTGKSAVFVCGPNGIVASTQKLVGEWIDEGKDVYWHAEKFRL